MRGKAARALLRYTKTAVQDLQHDEDEMLRGSRPRPAACPRCPGRPCSPLGV